MRADVVTVRPRAPLEEIINALASHAILGVPAVDDLYRVAGVVSEKDIFARLSGKADASFWEILSGCVYSNRCLIKSILSTTGTLTSEAINAMLCSLLVDLSLVGPDYRVCYYSDSAHRVFPRSAAVIGRDVKNCHPPKSVHTVEETLENFKSGKKDKATLPN